VKYPFFMNPNMKIIMRAIPGRSLGADARIVTRHRRSSQDAIAGKAGPF
jgi:hypothetical protein